MVVAIWGGHLPGQMLLVTSMEKGHIKKDFRSKLNVYDGDPPKKSTNKLPEWVTKKPVVSDIKDLTTSTITRNKKKYKWCTSYNNGQGAWGFHWKDGHEE